MGHGNYPLDALGLPIPDGSWPPGREAPSDLELVRRFCNSQNLEAGADLFRTPAELRAWIRAEGFADPGPLREADLRRVRQARAAVRELIEARGDARRGRAALESAQRVFAEVRVTVRLVDPPGIDSVGHGVHPLLARLAGAVFIARVDGTWDRLRACGHCRWVVYDHSKNGSAVWCSPRACGSRVKARAWRARQRERAGG